MTLEGRVRIVHAVQTLGGVVVTRVDDPSGNWNNGIIDWLKGEGFCLGHYRERERDRERKSTLLIDCTDWKREMKLFKREPSGGSSLDYQAHQITRFSRF